MDQATLRNAARVYCRMLGLPAFPDVMPYARVNETRARRIADAFETLPYGPTPDACIAYGFLRVEVANQFSLCRALGVRFTPFGDDATPYANSAEMRADLFNNNHLWVYNGGADHAILSRESNWQFRAVHDVFGHAMNGYQFGPRGEENAWRCHRLMFTRPAVLALTTETRGQNSWVNFGPFADRPAAARPYADQKAALLPDWCLDVD